MNKINFSISTLSGAFLVFAILCSPIVTVPIGFLLMYLLMLKVGLVWMVITILKNGTPSRHTFDERFYEDKDS